MRQVTKVLAELPLFEEIPSHNVVLDEVFPNRWTKTDQK
jgi:hypothetical protein